MNILISGSSGLIGNALVRQLPRSRHVVTRLLRYGPTSGTDAAAEAEPGVRVAAWDPGAGLLDPALIAGNDVIISLNGSNIAGRRWNAAYKQELLDSRVQPTQLIARAIAALPAQDQPQLWISCSAVGYYGSQPPDKPLTEEEHSGRGFLAAVCRDWEDATRPAEAAGARVVRLRLGIVLAADDGPLARIVEAFNKGLGGVVGSGTQMMSWVGIQDVVPAIQHLIEHREISGAVNLVAPHPVTNSEMTQAVASVLGKRVGMSLPAFAARLLLGEMADELLLASQNAVPARLQSSGFEFKYPELLPALNAVLKPV